MQRASAWPPRPISASPSMSWDDTVTIPAGQTATVPVLGYANASPSHSVGIGCKPTSTPDHALTYDIWVSAIRIGSLNGQ